MSPGQSSLSPPSFLLLTSCPPGLATWEARQGVGDIILFSRAADRGSRLREGVCFPGAMKLAEGAGRREAVKIGAERQAREMMTTRPDVMRHIVAEPLERCLARRKVSICAAFTTHQAACWHQRPEDHLPPGSSQTGGEVLTYWHK